LCGLDLVNGCWEHSVGSTRDLDPLKLADRSPRNVAKSSWYQRCTRSRTVQSVSAAKEENDGRWKTDNGRVGIPLLP
jgi:hypothetical protein